MARKITTEIWISELPDKQKVRYTYKDSVYLANKKKIEITCPTHGNFWQAAGSHKGGAGCPDCAKEKSGDTQRLTTEQYVSNALAQWLDKYDYSLVNYRSATKKIDIICKQHGVFSMAPNNHVNGINSQGCPKCATEAKAEKSKKTHQEFLEEAEQEHRGRYGYANAKYAGDKVKVAITCYTHGDFMQVPSNHLQGQGCPKCKKSGYQVAKPGSLYILSNDNITKVGITNRSVSTRSKEVTRSGGPLLDIKSSHWFNDGSIPLNIEGVVHKYLRDKYTPITEVFNGSTECFYDVDLQALTDFIVPLAAISTETNNRPNIN